jgi:hypothetical protein
MTLPCLIFVTMGNIPSKSYRKAQNTHFIFGNVFPKLVPSMRYFEKYCGAREAADGNMAARHRLGK